MLLGQVFDKFVAKAPVSVMVRGLLENVLQPGPIDEMFERTAEVQYTDKLLFSTVVDVMSLVACGIYKSPHAVHHEHPELFPVNLKSYYEKLQGIELAVMRQLVLDSAARQAAILKELDAPLPEILPGYRVKILDGNCLAGTEHRIKELRDNAAAPLPGKTLVVLDPQSGLITDIFPCEDGHAQERALLGGVLRSVQAGEAWIEDRNFCTLGWLCGVARRKACVLVREHKGLPWQAEEGSVLRHVGRVETGEVYEQVVTIEVEGEEDRQVLGPTLRLRRIVIKLDQPTRDGDTEIALLSNIWGLDALTLARAYLKRWAIENVFQVLTETLECEQSRLGYPKAALFAFSVTVVAYNVLSVIKGALRAVHGCVKVEREVSLHHLTESVRRAHEGMLISIPPPEWSCFRHLSPAQMAGQLRELARQVDLRKYKKAPTRPKKPKAPRKYDPAHPHVSTAKVLAERRRR